MEATLPVMLCARHPIDMLPEFAAGCVGSLIMLTNCALRFDVTSPLVEQAVIGSSLLTS